MAEGFSFIATTADLAQILGVSRELVLLLTRQNVLPRLSRNGNKFEYDLRDAVPAFFARKSVMDDQESDYEKERARLTKFQADLAEHKFHVETGKFGEVAEIHRVYLDKALRTKGKLRRLSRRLSVLALPADPRGREIMFRREIDDALSEMANPPEDEVDE